ncbi:serine/threonine-protein kinase [Aquipuribacter sp. SD81]|uniref:serine/threonine-protein kinase n=1 Tax=Aquipuribacter sp. SD81 TaxID=3127703 RepID=UPI0030172862
MSVGPGQSLGPYRLLRVIGEGGMGVVHLAMDPDERAVAVKVVRPHVATDPQTRERLAREVRTLSKVRHPRVAEVLDADFDADLPYVVMRFVPGDALDAVVRSRGPLRRPALDELMVGLVEALSAVHAVGVVHRDLKPGNVLLLDGAPVLIDFGIARAADDAQLTSTGLMVGTPGYLAPEVLEGTDVGEAADWWGWGAVVAFAATGRAPFRGGPMEAVFDRVRRGSADLDGVPEPLARLLAAALRPDPAARPGPDDLADAVARLTGRRPRLVPPGTGAAAPVVPGGGRGPGAPLTRPLTRVDVATASLPTVPPDAPETRVVERPPPARPPRRTAVTPAAAQPAGAAPRTAAPSRPVPAPDTTAPLPGVAYVPTSATGPARQAGPPAPVGPVGPGSPAPSGDGGPPALPAPPASVQPQQRWGAPVPDLPRRPLLALVAGAVLVAVAAVSPLGAAVVTLAWAGLARAVQWSRIAVARVRVRDGRVGAGTWTGQVFAYPFRVVGALLTSVGYVVLGVLALSPALLLAGALLLEARGVPWSNLDAVRATLTEPLVLSVAAVLTGLVAWWGPGGRAVRQGSRAMTEPALRHRNGRFVAAGLGGLVVVAALLVVTQQA